jgi:hypothetical protein
MDLKLNWESRDDSFTHAEQFQEELNETLMGSKYRVLSIRSGVISPNGMHQQLVFSHPRQISMDREVFDLVNRFNRATGLEWNALEYARLIDVTQITYLKIKGKWVDYASYIVDRMKKAQARSVVVSAGQTNVPALTLSQG